jgi:DNA-binding HxlR family transcriptional regulator
LQHASLNVSLVPMARSARPSRSSAKSVRRSACPIACALDLVGDRWTLLVLRDLFAGKTRYGEFAASAEGIPTNILAERLERLESAGLIESEPYQDNPPRFAYALTAKGRDLRPVLGALANWAQRHVPRTASDPAVRSALEGN